MSVSVEDSLELIESEAFQSFMKVNDPSVQTTWQDVELLITNTFSKTESEEFLSLALALGKYDYAGAPSNWRTNDHINVLKEWTQSMLEDYESHEDEIRRAIKTYRKGLIPDCFGMMISHFT